MQPCCTAPSEKSFAALAAVKAETWATGYGRVEVHFSVVYGLESLGIWLRARLGSAIVYDFRVFRNKRSAIFAFRCFFVYDTWYYSVRSTDRLQTVLATTTATPLHSRDNSRGRSALLPRIYPRVTHRFCSFIDCI